MQLDALFKILTDIRLILASTMLGAILMAYQLSLVIWQVIPLPAEEGGGLITKVSSSQNINQGPTTGQKIAQIRAQHLFGQVVVEKKVVQPVKIQDAPESNLNYKIRGIYYSEEKALASVILQKDSNTSNYYRLGDEIDTSIYIEQINEDHILISRLGRLEKLLLEKPTADLKRRGFSARTTTAKPSSSSASRVLQSYKRRYADNPLALAKRFQAIPVAENGKNIGYKLKSLRGESLLKKLDLKDDDVFLAINGIGLEKPFQALDALKSLTTAENVSVTVLRNGNRETLDFNLK